MSIDTTASYVEGKEFHRICLTSTGEKRSGITCRFSDCEKARGAHAQFLTHAHGVALEIALPVPVFRRCVREAWNCG
jgi:hypothetical protein